MPRYQVTAPYVVLKVTDRMSGGWTMRGFYRGAVVPDDIDPENLQHHIDGEMVAQLDEPKAAEGPKAEESKAGEPKVEPKVEPKARPDDEAKAEAPQPAAKPVRK